MHWWDVAPILFCLVITPVLIGFHVRWRWALLTGIAPGLCLLLAGAAIFATYSGRRLPPGEKSAFASLVALGVFCLAAPFVGIGLLAVLALPWRAAGSLYDTLFGRRLPPPKTPR